MKNHDTALHPLFPRLPYKGSYGVREASRGTGFPRTTIYRAIEEGRLTVIRLGKRGIRIPAQQLLTFIETHKEDPHHGGRWVFTQTRLDTDK